MFTYGQLASLLLLQLFLVIVGMWLSWNVHGMFFVRHEEKITAILVCGLLCSIMGMLFLGVLHAHDQAVQRCLFAFTNYTVEQCEVITRR